MYKKFLCSLLAIIFLISSFPTKINSSSQTVTIHYHRDDGDYDKWNVWLWEEDKDGKAYQLSEDDAFGKYTEIEISDTKNDIGFIIRTDDWEKDTGEDRFFKLDDGNELWVYSGKSEFLFEPPKEFYKNVDSAKNFNLTLNYFRYDNDYTNLTFSYWFDGENTKSKIPFERKLSLNNLENKKDFRFSILKNGNPIDYIDSELNISKIDKNNNLEVTLMQGTNKINYGNDTTLPENKVESSIITNINEIKVTLDVPIKIDSISNETFKINSNGTPSIISEIFPVLDSKTQFQNIEKNFAIEFLLRTSENLDYSKKYTLSYNNHETSPSLGNIFDSKEFIEHFIYTGDDLGSVYSKTSTKFRVWAPTASKVNLLIFENGEKKDHETPLKKIEMSKDIKGTWFHELMGDYKNKYYVYEAEVESVFREAVDPYAKAVGVNGNRGMIVDLSDTNPISFSETKIPKTDSPVDAILYEIHVRDISMSPNSGIKNKGKFLGFTELGTKNTSGLYTGLDHIKELGVTHIHLLPSFDYKTVDETKLNKKEFNWGYDPQNYNVPEGSYSTNPYQGSVRIKEFKELINTLHKNDLKVVMDVVYNHTYTALNSNFNNLVPNYYYRLDLNTNTFANGSACGNEIASERPMVRKMILDSVVYWATEYKIDGFRFDLMGLHDIETMNQIRAALNEVNPEILVYGEGWTGGTSPLPDEQKALKENAQSVDEYIAFFSDDIRDGIKGSVFEADDPGFVNGKFTRKEDVKFGIVGATKHDDINLEKISYSKKFWAKEPTQTVNYASAHDNLSLWDKLLATQGNYSDSTLLEINKLSAAIVLTSQGIPFFQAGEEFGRTKFGDENSYKSPDSINQIDWDLKTKNKELFEYYKGLIELRKNFSAFRLRTSDNIQKSIKFLDLNNEVISYTINNIDGYEQIAVFFNSSIKEKEFELERNNWDVFVNSERAGSSIIENISGNKIKINPKSALVIATKSKELIKKDDTSNLMQENNSKSLENIKAKNQLPTALTVVMFFVLLGGFLYWLKRKK